jgi:uncharacterized protein YjbI with pentapeptide repeats
MRYKVPSFTAEDSPREFPDWPSCAVEACGAVRLGEQEVCLAHLDPRARAEYLLRLEPGESLDLRGTTFTSLLLTQLLRAVQNASGQPEFGNVYFYRACFTEPADFDGVQFNGDAGFTGARFDREAYFVGAVFHGSAWFGQAVFAGVSTAFYDATFHRRAWLVAATFGFVAGFSRARFHGSAAFNQSKFKLANFEQAEFYSGAWFDEALFEQADFTQAVFRDDAWFRRTDYSADADFVDARFGRQARFEGSQAAGVLSFRGAQFERAWWLGPLLVHGTLLLSGSTFLETMYVEAATPRLDALRMKFAAGGTLRLRYASVILDRAVLAGASTITSAAPFRIDPPSAEHVLEAASEILASEEPDDALPETKLQEEGLEVMPRLLSLRRVDVTHLRLVNVDLRPCPFEGAHHLDLIVIEGVSPFANAPRPEYIRAGRWKLPRHRWTRRQTLAEEHHWRAAHVTARTGGQRRWRHRADSGWQSARDSQYMWLMERTGEAVNVVSPDRLAGEYRALRKAQEDNKNEPGAADFYYGEMEMRRHATTTPLAERAILTTYWLVAGYGLRGLRALTSLAAVVLVVASFFHFLGVDGRDPSYGSSILYVTEATISMESKFRAAPQVLTPIGELCRLAVRFTGPVLLALALLSIRNRVKR